MDKIIVALNVIVVLNKIIPIRGRKHASRYFDITSSGEFELNKIIPIRGRKRFQACE